MTDRVYRVGVIGCGRMGSTIDEDVRDHPAVLYPYSHAAAYAVISECKIVAATDINPEALSQFGQRWGVDRLYTDYSEMLAKEQLDIVSITTRATERATIVREALERGVRGIFAEKALATNLEDADAIVAMTKETQTVLGVNCSRRWHPGYMKALEMIQEGAIGRVRYVYGSCPGPMSHSGSHVIDVIRMFAGSSVSWVMGHTDPAAAASDDDLLGNAYLHFENGVVGFYNSSATNQVEFDVIGTKGRIRTTGNGVYWEYQTFSDVANLPVTQPFPQFVRTSATVTAIRDIIACLEGGGSPRCTAEDGRAALETAIAIRESERRGGVRVQLPLKDRTLRMNSK